MGVYSKYKNVNTTFGGKGGITLPTGGTADRDPSVVPGTLRYNTDLGLVEQYNALGWQSVDAPPTVTNISGTINENTSSTITLSGSNFKTGIIVYVTGAAVGGIERAMATTFGTSSSISFTTNATAVNFTGGASFGVKVVNPSGLSGVLDPAGTIDRDPIWSTAQGTIATIFDAYGSYSPIATVVASDPDGGTITYSLTSGSLPPGTSLNTSTGAISGDPTDVGGSVTSTFTITATSNNQAAARQFSIIVNPSQDGSSQAKAAASAQAIKTLTGTTTDGVYWLRNAANTVQYQAYCLMSNTYDSGGWTHLLSIKTNDGVNHSWADTTFWQGATAVGTPANWFNDSKTGAFTNFTGFTQILMLSYSGSGTYRAHARWSFISPYNNGSTTFQSIMQIANNATGQNVITGTRQVQSGTTTGATINTARPQTSWGCEFVDTGSGSGAALVVNWTGNQTGAKFSFNNDTINQLRITTANRGDGYPHTFGGLGGYHERPPGSYPATYEYEPVHAYCDPPYHFGTDSYNAQQSGYCSQGSALDRSIALFLK